MDPQTPFQPQVEDQAASVVPVSPAADVRAQITDRIKNGKNVLVTVGSNPSVDELASALGLTLLLGKLDKHATAVFSGEIPPAIEFLQPETTFENTVDSLRDFIIALDKEKADKLRYKVEDEFVKIFITPYKTIINEKDLQFSQGDFNVDIVLALGVEKREELDGAITAHGRILHDAVVVTINSGIQKSDLGSINWNDIEASSVAEMLVNLSAGFSPEILDAQISTAFLTGIVAETNRFSNEKTSPKVMTIAAQLMASGANQQLIATNLRHEGMISEPVRTKDEQAHDDNGEMVLEHEADKTASSQNSDKASDKKDEALTSVDLSSSSQEKTEESKPKNSGLDSEEGKEEKSKATKPKTAKKSEKASDSTASNSSKNEEAKEQLKAALDKASEPKVKVAEPLPEEPQRDFLESKVLDSEPESLGMPQEEQLVTTGSIEVAAPFEPITAHQPRVIQPLSSGDNQTPSIVSSLGEQTSEAPRITPMPTPTAMQAPTFGGTLNATTAGAEEDRVEQAEREASVNNIALNHDGGAGANNDAVEEARRAVQDAAVSQPFNPANNPIASINAQELPIAHESAPDTSVSSRQPHPLTPVSVPTTQFQEPSPVEAFMQPQTTPNALNNSFAVPSQQPSNLPGSLDANGLPPLPPMPTTNGGAMPPLPPLPGQAIDPSAGFQPQINPAFMQNTSQSQNPWTDAAEANTNRQAEQSVNRQQKMEQMDQQYNTAVDRNRELQGLPPLNDPNGSGFPPVNPPK